MGSGKREVLLPGEAKCSKYRSGQVPKFTQAIQAFRAFFCSDASGRSPHRNISPLAPRANTPGAYLRVFAMNRRLLEKKDRQADG